MNRKQLLTVISVTTLLSAFLVIFIGYIFKDQIPNQPLSTKPTVAEQLPQTEEIFLNGLASTPTKNSEWWQARADHRLLVQSIFACKKIGDATINSLPRAYYRTLLLDLTPEGDHAFRATASDIASLTSVEKNSKPLQLTGNENDLLAISDSIARARISAADGASVNVPWVQRLGIASVVISALATLFVTLQGRIRPYEMDDEGRKAFSESSFGSRMSLILIGPGACFRWIAFFAIALSIAGTSLAGLKQVYDPTRTLTQNTRALLELRQLQQEVVLAGVCDDESVTIAEHKAKWISKLRQVRATIVPDYGSYASLDLGGSFRQDQNADEHRTPVPRPAPPDRAQKSVSIESPPAKP